MQSSSATFSFKSAISRLSGLYDNGGLSRGTASRCWQICIWLHRAGRARSQKREMKFDRSDRDPLLALSFPPPCHLATPSLALFVAWSQPRELQNGVGAGPPGFRTFGVPHGHRRAPPVPRATLAPPPPPFRPVLSRVAHPILYDSLLSVTSLPPPLPVMLPRGIRWSGSP